MIVRVVVVQQLGRGILDETWPNGDKTTAGNNKSEQ